MNTKHQTHTDEMIGILGQWIDPAEPVWLRIRWLTQRLFEAEALAEAANAVELGRELVATGLRGAGSGFVDGIGLGYALAAYREGRKQ